MIKERLILFLLGVMLGSFMAINIIAKNDASAIILMFFVLIIATIIIMVGEK